MKTSLVILASVLLIAGIIGAVYAANTAPVTASVTVPGSISITSAGGLSFPDTTGGQVTDTLDVEIASNDNYKIEVKSEADNFDKDGGADTTMEDGALEGYDGSTWKAYTLAYQQLATGNAPGTPHNINHRLTVPGTATAGAYTLDITVKATQA